MPRPFLTARWEDLVLLNYSCPPELLEPWVPKGTVLDPWRGTHYISLVAFLFLDTRLRGFRIPLHQNFEEINLRFYVRREMADEEDRRGVVFLRELVPRRAIAAVARWVYNEPYRRVPMVHKVDIDPQTGGKARYQWKQRRSYFTITAEVEGPAEELRDDSEEQFITEHYWGYTRQRDGGTLEYQVEHPSWKVWSAKESEFHGPGHETYGVSFGEILASPPASTFVAVGSEVAVYPGARLDI
ncbi:MAG: DUF2071 domain-containing protein [Acidobacteriota bacterium]